MAASIEERLRKLPWKSLEESLWQRGHARTPRLLTSRQCAELVALYPRRERFRSRVEMERHRFGIGDYQYFAEPLPEPVQALRTHAYSHLAPIANRWMEALGLEQRPAPLPAATPALVAGRPAPLPAAMPALVAGRPAPLPAATPALVAGRYPPSLGELAALCRRLGQTKPTPLLLHYEAGGYNCLHQDLYGDVAFPFQLVCFLSRAGVDHTGGELLLVEQRPRAQSIGEAVAGEQGEAVIFTTRYRPVRGARGFYRAQMRHGVSRIRTGTRYTLGVIFHDAR